MTFLLACVFLTSIVACLCPISPHRRKRLFGALSGGMPLLFCIDGAGYQATGFLLTLLLRLFSFVLDESGLFEENTVTRLTFLLPLTASAYLLFYACSLPGIYYVSLIAVDLLGLWMPMSFLGKDPRHPSQWQ